MCVNTVRRYYIYARESVKRRRRGQRTSPYTDGQSEKKRKAQHPPKHRYYISGRTTDGNRSDGFKFPLQRTEHGHGYIKPPTAYTDGRSEKKRSTPPDHRYYISGRTTDNGRQPLRRLQISAPTNGTRSRLYQTAVTVHGRTERKKEKRSTPPTTVTI